MTTSPTTLTAGPEPEILGPDSLTWRFLGDSRNVLLAQRAAVLQAMHPAIGAAILEHSNVREDPIGRLVRSAGPILGVVYDEDAIATGRWIRDQHPGIRGVDQHGRRYHALDPETYFWAHATFVESQIATQELFGTPLSYAERCRLYAESIDWYERYGLTMRPVPPDYATFSRYWKRMLTQVLEPTPVARAAVQYGRALAPPKFLRLPDPAWRLMRPLAANAGPWLVRATLPADARALLEVRWRPVDRAAFELFRAAVRASWSLTPRKIRRLPRARAADIRTHT